MKLNRILEDKIKYSIENFPITIILGARQVGKTTLAKQIISILIKEDPQKTLNDDFIYLDLESPRDLNLLSDAEFFFEYNKDKIICLDEVQTYLPIFPILRSVIDRNERNIKIILLGSASPILLEKSSESLAGRCSYIELSPFIYTEIINENIKIEQLLSRGGFPPSLLARNDEFSYEWRQNYIKTFVERDLPMLGYKKNVASTIRLWTMLAYNNANLLNLNTLAVSMQTSPTTIKSNIEILSELFMIYILKPYYKSNKKRLIKTPKLYFRDTGILNYFLGISSFNQLYSHISFGYIFETLVISNILAYLPTTFFPFFFRTASGDELDLIIEVNKKIIAIEIKATTAPKLTKQNFNAIRELKPDEIYVVNLGVEEYFLHDNIYALPLDKMINKIINYKNEQETLVC